MSKRARLDGPHALRVTWPPGEPYNVEYDTVVEPGHLLPADAPAKLRDDLLKRDNWSEVADPSQSSSAKSTSTAKPTTDKQEEGTSNG